MIKVTVWNEFSFSCRCEAALAIYPQGHHETIKAFLNAEKDIEATAATLEMPHQGLPDDLLAATDVLIWWGHCRHDDVTDELADKIARRVQEGMGLILLHSSHLSKPFKRVIGASGQLCWGEDGERERLWVAAPWHPIAKGLPAYTDLPKEVMYGEPLARPAPETTVFNCWYQGGRVFRGGVTFRRGAGKVFYFQPGHETFPTFHNPLIQKVLVNAVRWAYNDNKLATTDCSCVTPIEPVDGRAAP